MFGAKTLDPGPIIRRQESTFLTSCLNDWHQLRLSSRRQKRARKAGTVQTTYVCLALDARVTIIQDKGYWRFQTEVERIMAYRCSKCIAFCLLSCRDNSTLNIFICGATVTLQQDQGHRHEYEHVCHAYVYRPDRFDYHSLKILSEILLWNYKWKRCPLWDTAVTLSESQGHRTEKRLHGYFVASFHIVSGFLFSKF